MFITSRESAMIPFTFCHHIHSRAGSLGPRAFLSGDCLALNCLSEGFRCSEHISTPKNPASERISVFPWVLGLFFGFREIPRREQKLYIVGAGTEDTIRSAARVERAQSLAVR